MPYILPEKRDDLDPVIEQLSGRLINSGAGELNYVITRLLSDHYMFNRYAFINEAIGILECAKQEFYRRVAVPYEDKKIAENGDVYD